MLCRVWSFQNSTPPLQCYLSFSQWADELGCKRRHAITVLNGLIEKNLLSKQSRGTQANIWELVHTEHQQELASAYRTLPSVYTAPVLVHTEHHASVLYAPKKIIEDQLEDQVEDHTVADAPAPTWEFSSTLEEPQDSDPLQESDSLEKPIEISEAPPIPAAPPKTTRKARKGAEVPFPPAEYWQGVTPSLVKWAIDNGVAELVAQKWVAKKIDDMADSAAAKGYRFIDWAAAFRKWYRKELPKDDGIEADLRKAAQYVFLSAKGGEGEKPVPSSAVWPAINKAIKALGGKEYLAGLANISEEWKDKKLTELKKFARDHLEGA